MSTYTVSASYGLDTVPSNFRLEADGMMEAAVLAMARLTLESPDRVKTLRVNEVVS